MRVSLHAGTAEPVSCVLWIWTSFTCYTLFLFLFLVRFARRRLPSSVRRSVEVTVVPFASGGESGRLCSVPESKNIHKLCRQFGNKLVTLSLSQGECAPEVKTTDVQHGVPFHPG